MPLELITPVTPARPDAPDPSTPRRLDELIAELALADRWPTPADYCHRCGLAPCLSVTWPESGDCTGVHQVPTLRTWAALAAGDALRAAGIRHDTPGRRDLALALVRAIERTA